MASSELAVAINKLLPTAAMVCGWILALPAMREWLSAAEAEPEVIEDP